MENILWIFELFMIGGVIFSLAMYFILKHHTKNKKSSN